MGKNPNFRFSPFSRRRLIFQTLKCFFFKYISLKGFSRHIIRIFVFFLAILDIYRHGLLNANHNTLNYSLFSKCFSWFLYLCVHRGSGVFSCFCFLLSSVSRISRSLHACLRLTKKRWKIGPVLQIQASSMKLRVHGFLFLVFLHIKTNGQNKLFL